MVLCHSVGVIGKSALEIGQFLRRNFWMISGGPFLSRPLCFTAEQKASHIPEDLAEHKTQCSLVYPYPSVSELEGGDSDHGPSKTRTKTQTTPDSGFTRQRRNSDHGLSFWGEGELRPRSEFWGVFGVGVDEGALRKEPANERLKNLRKQRVNREK